MFMICFSAEVETVDFSSKTTANQINDWCSQVTKNHIKNIVSPADIEQSVIILINAIFFNGYWKKPFLQNETAPQPFYLNSKTPVSVQFMRQSENFYYLESDELNAKILRLPYKVSLNLNQLEFVQGLSNHRSKFKILINSFSCRVISSPCTFSSQRKLMA